MKGKQFSVAACRETIDRGHELLDKFPGDTKEERLVRMLDLAEAELTTRGMSPRFDSHLRALCDSAENIKTMALAMAKAAEERVNRETDELKEISAAKDRALAEKQKANDTLQEQLDAAHAQIQSEQEAADNEREALTKELNERDILLNDLRKRIDEQSLVIKLQTDKNDRLEDELRKARDEIQRLHELQRQEELQNSQDETQHLWDDLLEEVSID